MIVLALNSTVLALLWLAITGSFTVPNFVLGLLVAAVALSLTRTRPLYEQAVRVRRLVGLSLLFVRELIVSAWRVARLVVSPRMDLKPGIFAYPLKARTDFEISLLANLITLTPGTLSVDVSADRRMLFVHAIDCSDVAQTIREIESGFERRIRETFQK